MPTAPGSRTGGAYAGGPTARRGSGGTDAGAGGSATSGPARGRAAGSGGSYGGAPEDVPSERGQGPGWSAPWWAGPAGRPTGTVPWEGGSGRSGWDDLFAGTRGTAGRSGRQPSGAEVARALLDAFRRGMRDR
jgi:hypothetical protein